MENLLKRIKDMQNIEPDDALTKLIDECSDDSSGELFENDLDFVMAAGKDNFDEFMKHIKKDK